MNKTINPIKWLFLLILVIQVVITISSYWILTGVYSISSVPSLIITCIALLFSILLYSQRKYLTPPPSDKEQKPSRMFLFFCAIIAFASILFIQYYAASIILLSMPVLYADEWHVFHRIISSEHITNTLFSRYNHHPSYFLNVLYWINLNFFRCSSLWFTSINLCSILGVALIYFKAVKKSRSNNEYEILILAIFSAIWAFWIMGANNMFWNLAYLPVLSSVVSIYGLSIQSKSNYKKGALIFFIGALITSISFGSGAILWLLGAMAAIFKKLERKVIIAYALLGVGGSALSMGIFSLSKSAASLPSTYDLIMATPAFLGRTLTMPFYENLAQGEFPKLEVTIGFIGLLVLFTLIFILRKHLKDNTLVLFSTLLASYSIGFGFLVAFGRMKSNLTLMAAGRYTNWSVLFWTAIILLLIALILKIKSTVLRKILIITFCITGLITLLISNRMMINNRLITYNIAVRGKAAIVTNPKVKGNSTFLWGGAAKNATLWNKLLEVNAQLKEEDLNIYTELVTSSLGKDINNLVIENDPISGSFNSGSDQDGNYYLEGYLNGQSMAIGLLIVQEKKVIGIGYPYSDYYFLNQSQKDQKFIRQPFQYYPGTSNYFWGQFLPNAQLSTNIQVYAFLKNGNLALINSE